MIILCKIGMIDIQLLSDMTLMAIVLDNLDVCDQLYPFATRNWTEAY
jgi:hypothetical protein